MTRNERMIAAGMAPGATIAASTLGGATVFDHNSLADRIFEIC